MAEGKVSVHISQQADFRFEAQYGGTVPPLVADEPEPLGHGAGPSPIQLLATAVANCLSGSLLFALRKYKQAPEPLSCTVEAEVGRNAEGRLRVLGMQAQIKLGVPAASLQHLDRVLSQFEAFCTVKQSIAAGVPVEVQVFDAEGVRLK